ncbi:MAG: hypothetical protein ABJB12_02400 [Pseudomonadota bacterium]
MSAVLLCAAATRAPAEPAARFPDAPASSASAGHSVSAEPVNAARASSSVPAVDGASPGLEPRAPATQLTQPATTQSWSRRLALSHFARAAELERRGEIAQALSEYTESLAIDSTLGEAYLRLGSLRARMGDPREAELVYSAAVRLGDTRGRALLQRSHLYRAAGRGELALRDLEAAVAVEANREALQELAEHYVEAHAFSAALFTFRRIVASAEADADPSALAAARLEVRALRVLAAETDPTAERPKRHDWVGRALYAISRR